MSESTITLNLRVRGGATTFISTKKTEGGSGISRKTKNNTDPQQKHKNGGISFKNILQGGKTPTVVPKKAGTKHSPYIVEQLNC